MVHEAIRILPREEPVDKRQDAKSMDSKPDQYRQHVPASLAQHFGEFALGLGLAEARRYEAKNTQRGYSGNNS